MLLPNYIQFIQKYSNAAHNALTVVMTWKLKTKHFQLISNEGNRLARNSHKFFCKYIQISLFK